MELSDLLLVHIVKWIPKHQSNIQLWMIDMARMLKRENFQPTTFWEIWVKNKFLISSP